MGSSGHSTPSMERRGVEDITRYSPENSQNEEFSQEQCMVAKNGHEFRREGEKLCYMSVTERPLPVRHYTLGNGGAALGSECT